MGVEIRERLHAELQGLLGEAVRTDPVALQEARADRSGRVSGAVPLAVVEARSIDDVRRALRFATEHRVPVVPRGAGTGLAGGAVAGAGELVLSTRGMTRILEVSRDDQLAVVEPGIINADLNAALEPDGLWWAPDPASRAISTVGGNIATGAGGLLCAKYGVTREAVLGLKVVLADGRLLELGHRTVKGVTGYDLTALMIGSEGTLGVIVEATLRLRPLPRGEAVTVRGAFPDVEAAARAAAVITGRGIGPSIMELLDGRAIAILDRYFADRGTDTGLAGSGACLLVQTDGDAAAAEAQEAATVIRTLGGEVAVAADGAEGERLFAVRRAFHPAIESTGECLIEDVAVPRSALPAMFAEIQRIEREHGVEIPTVAHAGDGNLHPNLVVDAVRDPDGHLEVPERIWAAADDLFRSCLRLGGTLTGEHGVGILKRRWLRDELGEDQVELQRDLKRVFDPLGILNPGKVF